MPAWPFGAVWDACAGGRKDRWLKRGPGRSGTLGAVMGPPRGRARGRVGAVLGAVRKNGICGENIFGKGSKSEKPFKGRKSQKPHFSRTAPRTAPRRPLARPLGGP